MYYFAINPSCLVMPDGKVVTFYFHVPRKTRDIGDIVPEIVKITLLRFMYQWPKDPMNDKSATVSQSQGRHKHPGQFDCLFSYHKRRYQSLCY